MQQCGKLCFDWWPGPGTWLHQFSFIATAGTLQSVYGIQHMAFSRDSSKRLAQKLSMTYQNQGLQQGLQNSSAVLAFCTICLLRLTVLRISVPLEPVINNGSLRNTAYTSLYHVHGHHGQSCTLIILPACACVCVLMCDCLVCFLWLVR